MQPRVLLDGLAIPESPRWHEHRLWFSNWGVTFPVGAGANGPVPSTIAVSWMLCPSVISLAVGVVVI
jgi:hypothetical protein